MTTFRDLFNRHALVEAEENAKMQATAPPGYVAMALVPVEVFGENDCCEHGTAADCESAGYGISDAVSAWSDCNRAIGRIYRVDEPGGQRYREPGETVIIYVPEASVPWFEKKWGDG